MADGKLMFAALGAAVALTGVGFGAAAADLPVAAPATQIFAVPPASTFAVPVGRLDAQKQLRVVLSLPIRVDAAVQFVLLVSTPGSRFYGRYLTPEQFAARFGADAARFQAVVDWAQANGLKIDQRSKARTTISVRGSVAKIEALFKTKLVAFNTRDGGQGFAPVVAPTLPDALVGQVTEVVGLASARQYAAQLRTAPAGQPQTAGGTGVLGGYSPSDFRAAYNIPSQPSNDLTETAAVFEQGGFDQNDLDVFSRRYGLPRIPATVRGVDGYNGHVNNKSIEAEAVTDIDTIFGLNPLLKQIMVYEQGQDPFAVALLDSLTAMADDDAAQTISISYGDFEANMGAASIRAEFYVLLQMAAEGQTVYASAGDAGAYDFTSTGVSLGVLDPASQQVVTGVGGTTLFTGPGSSFFAETAWNLLLENHGATGGGISGFWATPPYQFPGPFDPISVEAFNGGSSVFRNVPDVAADASPATGASIYSAANGGWVIEGGTSLSAPIWAGFSSILNATRSSLGYPRVGFFNRLLYTLGESGFAIHDVTDGTNGNANAFGIPGYTAGVGADDVSGFGSMNGGLYLYNFIIQDEQGSDGGSPPERVRSLSAAPSATSVKLSWTEVPTAQSYLVEVYPKSAPQTIKFGAIQSLSSSNATSINVTGLTPGV